MSAPDGDDVVEQVVGAGEALVAEAEGDEAELPLGASSVSRIHRRTLATPSRSIAASVAVLVGVEEHAVDDAVDDKDGHYCSNKNVDYAEEAAAVVDNDYTVVVVEEQDDVVVAAAAGRDRRERC